MVELGCKYRDVVTEFNGTAIGYVQYITGCNQVLIVPQVSKDGVYKEAHWIDEQRLQKIPGNKVVLNTIASVKKQNPGFDKPAPK